MKLLKRLCVALAMMLVVATPCVLKDAPMQALAEEVPTDPSTTEVLPPSEPTDTSENTPSEGDSNTDVPSDPIFHEQRYIRRADDEHYQELALISENQFTMTYVEGMTHYDVKGTYIIEGNVITLISEDTGLKDNKLVLNNNGTFSVYVPPIGNGEYSASDYISYLFSQAWFYLPVLITILVAIGVPAITNIIKITAGSRLHTAQNRKLIKKQNELVKANSVLVQSMQNNIQKEIYFLDQLKSATVNKKQIAIIEARLSNLRVEAKQYNDQVEIVEIKESELSKKSIKAEKKEAKQEAKKVKVKVKVNKEG